MRVFPSLLLLLLLPLRELILAEEQQRVAEELQNAKREQINERRKEGRKKMREDALAGGWKWEEKDTRVDRGRGGAEGEG